MPLGFVVIAVYIYAIRKFERRYRDLNAIHPLNDRSDFQDIGGQHDVHDIEAIQSVDSSD